MIVSLIRRGTW